MFTECQVAQDPAGPSLAVCNVTVRCSIRRSGMKVLTWGSWNFYETANLSEQAGSFGTCFILNMTVLDNRIYRKKRRLKEVLLTGKPCKTSTMPHGETKQLCQAIFQALLIAVTNMSTHRRWSIETNSAGLFAQVYPTWDSLNGFSSVWRCHRRWNKPPNTIHNAMPHIWTLPKDPCSHNSAHHYRINASGGLKHSDT